MIGFVTRRYASASILMQMSRRSVEQRYRGSMFGALWTFLTPLLMLVVYTFIFTQVFTVRWGQEVGEGAVGGFGTFEYAIVLFAGLSLYAFFSEVLITSNTAITRHANYVTKIVFPLRVLPIVDLMSSLFQLGVSLLILVLFQLVVARSIPATALLAPVPVLLLVVMTAGLAWWMATLGAYFRDLSQVVTPIVTALLFLGPILYPMTSFTPAVQPWLSLSPLTVPIEAFRDLLLWGSMPDWRALAVYAAVAVAVAVSGWNIFTLGRAGFADVL